MPFLVNCDSLGSNVGSLLSKLLQFLLHLVKVLLFLGGGRSSRGEREWVVDEKDRRGFRVFRREEDLNIVRLGELLNPIKST